MTIAASNPTMWTISEATPRSGRRNCDNEQVGRDSTAQKRDRRRYRSADHTEHADKDQDDAPE
jgi:hypothetical protein